MKQEIRDVDIHKISVNPYQPRRHMGREELEELAQSLQSVGLIQPPVVRPVVGQEERYELISGERRLRAAQIAGWQKISVLVSEKGGDYSAEGALIENIQRVDLNPMEVAAALRRLIQEFGYRHEELADRVGKKRSTLTNYLRLMSLPKKIQDSLSAGEISFGHAKSILSVEGFEKQLMLHEKVVSEGLSVRDTETAAQKGDVAPKRRLEKVSSKDCYVDELETKLQHRLGTKVDVQMQGKGGRICIDFYSLDDLDRILEIVGVAPN